MAIIDEQRTKNRLDHQAVVGRLNRLQRMIRTRVPLWRAKREKQEVIARNTRRRLDEG